MYIVFSQHTTRTWSDGVRCVCDASHTRQEDSQKWDGFISFSDFYESQSLLSQWSQPVPKRNKNEWMALHEGRWCLLLFAARRQQNWNVLVLRFTCLFCVGVMSSNSFPRIRVRAKRTFSDVKICFVWMRQINFRFKSQWKCGGHTIVHHHDDMIRLATKKNRTMITMTNNCVFVPTVKIFSSTEFGTVQFWPLIVPFKEWNSSWDFCCWRLVSRVPRDSSWPVGVTWSMRNSWANKK